MANLWNVLTLALLVAGVTSLPTTQSCSGRYPTAEHSITLHRTAAPAVGNFEGDITVGSQTVRAVFDTGSSNTWFMDPGAQCLNTTTLKPIPLSLCGFQGPRLEPSASFQAIPNQHMNLSFLDGEGIIAAPGYNSMLFGGIEVPKQEFGLATIVVSEYAGNATGLVGLAFPAFTDTFPGSDPSKDVSCGVGTTTKKPGCNEHHYSPLISTIFKQDLTPPVFTFAISRAANPAGVMTIGGLPEVNEPHVNVTSDSVEATVPMEKIKSTQEFLTYVITVDDLHYNGASAGAGKGQYIVDTGTIQIVIDKKDAAHINAQFDPPAQFDKDFGIYLVPCNATAPEFGINIGGETFMLNGEDLILDPGPGYDYCESAFQVGEAPFIVGSVFLRNVLAVFDVGSKEMSFVSRMYYEE